MDAERRWCPAKEVSSKMISKLPKYNLISDI
jgi:hypothetical protein